MDWIRRRPRAAAVAGVGAVLMVLTLVYLMVSSTGTAPETRAIDDLSGLPTASSTPTFDFPTPTPAAPSPSAPATAGGGSGSAGNGLDGLEIGGAPIQSGTVALPGLAGGSVFQFASKHRIVLTVTSQGPIGTIGYYIPYSPDKQSGTVKNVGKNWSLRTVSYGDPDYARIYLRSGANPAIPITCTISVDGKVVTRKTTDGPYALLICQG